MFQSLFCWKRLIGGPLSAATGDPVRGFNPCSVGSGSSARTTRRLGPWRFQFQSLFCWKRLIGHEIRRRSASTRHVSILVLLEAAHRRLAEIAPIKVGDVSILVLLEAAHRLLDKQMT